MKKVLFLNLIVLFTCNFISAQEDFEIDKSDELFEKDWTNFEHLFSDEMENDNNQVYLSESPELSSSGITQNNQRILSHKFNSYADMPIHVPDSTIHYQIKTYDPK